MPSTSSLPGVIPDAVPAGDPADPRPADQLRTALAAALDGLPPRRAAAGVERLIAHYRGPGPRTGAPALRDRADAVAYAAYRMPATFEAVATALRALARRLPDWAPRRLLDLAGGTGAACWAAADVFGPALTDVTVLDQAADALRLGRDLARGGPPALRAAQWRRQQFGATTPELPEADLVTVSYLLGEVPETTRHALLAAAAAAGRAVVVVEPGTPQGYARVRAARQQLTAAGWRLVAPCPHGGECPITPGDDWCHFAARVARSSLHRQVKGGSLGYEDEKFSYVAAVHPTLAPAEPPAHRIVRRPQYRKGMVLLDLCTDDGELRRTSVTRRHGARYRAARAIGWGGDWPPSEADPR